MWNSATCPLFVKGRHSICNPASSGCQFELLAFYVSTVHVWIYQSTQISCEYPIQLFMYLRYGLNASANIGVSIQRFIYLPSHFITRCLCMVPKGYDRVLTTAPPLRTWCSTYLTKPLFPYVGAGWDSSHGSSRVCSQNQRLCKYIRIVEISREISHPRTASAVNLNLMWICLHLWILPVELDSLEACLW